MRALARISIDGDTARAAACVAAVRAAGFAECELVVAGTPLCQTGLDIRPVSVLVRPASVPRRESEVITLVNGLLEWAARGGMSHLTLPAGLVAGLSEQEPPDSYESAFQAVFRSLEQLKQGAAAHGVRIALAVPHARFLLSPLECVDLIDAVNSPYVGLGVVAAVADRAGRATDWVRIAGGRLFWVDACDVADADPLDRALYLTGYDGLVIRPCPDGAR